MYEASRVIELDLHDIKSTMSWKYFAARRRATGTQDQPLGRQPHPPVAVVGGRIPPPTTEFPELIDNSFRSVVEELLQLGAG